jgi:hypothetical protein
LGIAELNIEVGRQRKSSMIGKVSLTGMQKRP